MGKRRIRQNIVFKALLNEQEITNLCKINTHIYQFLSTSLNGKANSNLKFNM